MDISESVMRDGLRRMESAKDKEIAELRAQLAEEKEENTILLKCLNGSTKATYTAELYDMERSRADEAEAQLARCKNDLTLIVKRWHDGEWQTVGDCLLDIQAIIACLPKTAALNAEILRCAEALVSEMESNRYWIMATEQEHDLDRAVRARNEGV